MRTSHRYTVRSALPVSSRPYPEVTNKAFRRVYMKIADNPSFEDQDVLWLQADGWYADIRIKLDGSGFSSFGGRVTWRRPKLTFHHDLDLGSGFPEDIGTISLTSFGCIENGEFVNGGEVIPFEEKWSCPAGAVSSRVLLRRSRKSITGMEIQLGDDCIIILEGTAARFRRVGHTWRTHYRAQGFPPCRRPTGVRPLAGWNLVEQVSAVTGTSSS